MLIKCTPPPLKCLQRKPSYLYFFYCLFVFVSKQNSSWECKLVSVHGDVFWHEGREGPVDLSALDYLSAHFVIETSCLFQIKITGMVMY